MTLDTDILEGVRPDDTIEEGFNKVQAAINALRFQIEQLMARIEQLESKSR